MEEENEGMKTEGVVGLCSRDTDASNKKIGKDANTDRAGNRLTGILDPPRSLLGTFYDASVHSEFDAERQI